MMFAYNPVVSGPGFGPKFHKISGLFLAQFMGGGTILKVRSSRYKLEFPG